MQWDNDNGGGPWGQPPKPQQPPDVDQFIRNLREKMGDKFPGHRKTWPYLALGAALIWLASGIYVVGPDEQGVVTRFGRFIQITDPGPHMRLPYPIEEVYKPKVTQVQRIEIGYRTRGRTVTDMPPESLMLTGDENIIDIDMSVQFRIKDAADYLFNIRNPANDPDKLVRDVTETAIRRVIGRNSIDEALTTGKERIQAATKQLMQEILDLYKSGITVMAVQLQQVAPPEEVIHAFKDVASAREDRERAINESQGYANDILPRAKGEAAKVIQEAEAYKVAKVSRAKGEVDRFTALLTEYRKAKQVTSTRLYLETMEDALQHANKVIIDPKTAGNILPYLPLDRTNPPKIPDGRNATTTKSGSGP